MKGKLTPIDRRKAEQWREIFIGVVGGNIGAARADKIVKAGEEAFKILGSMTYKEFRNVKAVLNESTPPIKP